MSVALQSFTEHSRAASGRLNRGVLWIDPMPAFFTGCVPEHTCSLLSFQSWLLLAIVTCGIQTQDYSTGSSPSRVLSGQKPDFLLLPDLRQQTNVKPCCLPSQCCAAGGNLRVCTHVLAAGLQYNL